MLHIDEQSTIKLEDQSTTQLGDQSTIKTSDQVSTTQGTHHPTSQGQNYNQRPDQFTTKARTTLTGDELSRSEKSIFPQRNETRIHNLHDCIRPTFTGISKSETKRFTIFAACLLCNY